MRFFSDFHYNGVMTNDEFLEKSFLKIKNQISEELSDATRTDALNLRISAEYKDALGRLEKILPKVHCVLDLYYLGEEDFLFALDCLENYADIFVVDGRDEKRFKETQAEFSQLEEILSEFYDDDEDDDETEESDDFEDDDSDGSEDDFENEDFDEDSDDNGAESDSDTNGGK